MSVLVCLPSGRTRVWERERRGAVAWEEAARWIEDAEGIPAHALTLRADGRPVRPGSPPLPVDASLRVGLRVAGGAGRKKGKGGGRGGGGDDDNSGRKRKTKKEKAAESKVRAASSKGTGFALVHEELSGNYNGKTPLAAAKKAYRALGGKIKTVLVLQERGSGELHCFEVRELLLDSGKQFKRGRGARDRASVSDDW